MSRRGSDSASSRVFADVGAACAAVLRNRKMGKRLLPSVEELALVVNANVDRGSLEIVDMIFLPLSLLMNASVQQKEKGKEEVPRTKQRGPNTRVAATKDEDGEGDGAEGTTVTPSPSSSPLQMKGVSREKVLLATLECLHAFIRMLRESLQGGLLAPGGERVEQVTRSLLLWLSHFLQHHAAFSEEVNLKVTAILAYSYERFLGLAVNLSTLSSPYPDSGVPGHTDHPQHSLVPHFGCHVAFVLDQICAASRLGQQGSKSLVKSLLEALKRIIVFLGKERSVAAFFLPGLVSKLSELLLLAAGKTKQTTRDMMMTMMVGNRGDISDDISGPSSSASSSSTQQCVVTGPMASSACVEGAIECLTCILVFCFETEAAESSRNRTTMALEDEGEESSSSQHLDRLQRIVSGMNGPKSDDGASEAAKREHAVSSSGHKRKGDRAFRVDCDEDWRRTTFLKVESMLAHFYPDLCGHPSPTVRKALAASISKLVKSCKRPFEQSRSCLECLLALSHDENTRISEKASDLVYTFGERYRVASSVSASPSSSSSVGCGDRGEFLRGVDRLFMDFVGKLVPAAKDTSSSSFTLLAKKVSSLLCLGRCMYMKHLYREKLPHLTTFLDALRQCFSFDPTLGPASIESGGPGLVWYKNPNQKGANKNKSASAAVVLPRMRSNFAFLHRIEDYNAATMMCRALGIIALETQCSELHCPVFDYIVKEYYLGALGEGVLPSDDDNKEGGISNLTLSSLPIDSRSSGRSLSRAAWHMKAMSSCTMIQEMLVGCKCQPTFQPGGGGRKGEDDKASDGGQNITDDGDDDGEGMRRGEGARRRMREEKQLKYISSAVADLIEEHTSAALWEERIGDGRASNQQNRLLSKKSTQLACVILESFGVFGRVMGEDFQQSYTFLPSVLYVLLDKLGDESNRAVAIAARAALHCICAHCKYASIADLLFQNSDHLIDTLVTHLMHLQLYPETTRVFKAIVRIMMEVDDNEDDDDEDGGSSRRGKRVFWFLGLIREPFDVFLATFFCANGQRFTTNEESEILSQVAEICLVAAKARIHRKLHEEDMLTFLEETCEKCALVQSELLHAATRGYMYRRLLRAVSCCVNALKALSSGKLLSTVAAVWPMLMIRVEKRPSCPDTLACVSVLCNAGGDFMAGRIQKDLWPLMQNVLLVPPGSTSGNVVGNVGDLEGGLHLSQRAPLEMLPTIFGICNKRTTLRVARALCHLEEKRQRILQSSQSASPNTAGPDAAAAHSQLIQKAISTMLAVDHDAMFGFLHADLPPLVL